MKGTAGIVGLCAYASVDVCMSSIRVPVYVCYCCVYAGGDGCICNYSSGMHSSVSVFVRTNQNTKVGYIGRVRGSYKGK